MAGQPLLLFHAKENAQCDWGGSARLTSSSQLLVRVACAEGYTQPIPTVGTSSDEPDVYVQGKASVLALLKNW